MNAVARLGSSYHEISTVNRDIKAALAVAQSNARDARSRLSGLVELEPGECAEYSPGRYIRCREVQSQRTVTPDVLITAIQSVTDQDLKERCARMKANGGEVEEDIEWWKSVLDQTRDLGCIQTSCVIEFCESRGRQEKKDITEEAAAAALQAERCMAIVREIKSRLRPEPEFEEIDVQLVRGIIEERGGSVRATVRTADGRDHAYKLTQKKISRRKTSTPATLGSRDVINNSRSLITSLRSAARNQMGGLENIVPDALVEMINTTLREQVDIKITRID